MKIVFLSLVAVCALRAAGPVSLPVRKLRDFALTDQYAQVRTYRFPKPTVTVMAVADYHGAMQLTPWIKSIYDRYQKRIDIDGVADVSMIPDLFRAALRGLFKKGLTHSVMLDWDGSVVKQFAYQRGVANIYVIDRHGWIVGRFTGQFSDQSLRTLFTQIDAEIAKTG
jgi:hypothetical protein